VADLIVAILVCGRFGRNSFILPIITKQTNTDNSVAGRQ